MKKVYSLFCLLFLLLGTVQAQQTTTVQGRPYDFSKAPKATRSTTMKAPRSADFGFDNIEFWVGTGDSKAGFAVQWNDPKETNALVWGYRFDGDKRGIDIITDIARADPRLYVMVENADASMGYTICGIGYDVDGDGEIALRQKSTGKILQPSEEGIFYTLGHYDYDDYEAVDPDDYWGSGWYQSYWSYWVKEGNGDFGYSGLGASSRKLKDGSWDGWNFARNMQTTGFKEFVAAPVPGYTSGTFFLCGNANGTGNNLLNYYNEKGEWEYKLYQKANDSQTLGSDIRFGTVFGNNLYFLSAGNGSLIAADAGKAIHKGTIGNIDGRAFAGVDSRKGYVGTANGIYIVDLEKLTLGDLVPGTANNLETGRMVHAGNSVFAVQKGKGIFVIDPETDRIGQTFEGDYTTLAQTADGSVWAATGNQIVRINPASLAITERIDLPGYCKIGNNWGSRNAGTFTADPKSNTLFWTDGGFAGGGNSVYRYESGNPASLESPFFTLPHEDEVFCGTGIRPDSRTGQLVVMAASTKSGKNLIYYVDAQNGDLLRTLEAEKEFLTPLFPLFPDALPVISGIESNYTVALNSAPVVISLKGKVTDADNPDYNISIRVVSENPELASAGLNNQVLTITPQPGQSGETTIILTAESNGQVVTKKINLVVTRALEGIRLDRKEITLKKGSKDTLKVAFTPENATNQELKWSYSDYSTANVNNGVVSTSSKLGVGYIYVKSVEGGFADTCKVTVVNEPVTGVKISKKQTSVFVNQKDTVTAQILPADASNKTLNWKSKDATIATVPSYNGVITGKKEGKTLIYVNSSDGNFADSCEVSVSFNPATGMSLKKTELWLTAPKTEFVEVVFSPVDASNKDFTWESRNPEVATVDQYGWVKSVSAGETEVVARSVDNPDLTAVCKVTSSYVATTGITLSETEKTIAVNKSFTVSETVAPAGVSNSAVNWTTSDDKIVTVSNYGSVKGIAPGKAVITCTTVEGEFAATCEFTVVDTIHVTGIKLSASEIWLKKGKSQQPSRTFAPADASNTNYSYQSGDESIATVSKYGSIAAVSLGTTKVVVTTQDRGLTDTCTVHVVPDVERVMLDAGTAELYVGADRQLSAVAAPENAIQTVKWTSSDETVATVGDNGLVTALKAGTAEIVATSTDLNTITAVCKVTVKDQLAETVVLNETQKVLLTGEGLQLSAVVSPENTTNARVRWTTSDYTLATVTSYGYVKAFQPGTVTIRAISTDGSNRHAACVITIKQPADRILLNEISKEIEAGKEFRLLATVLPENTTDKEVVWSISDEQVATVSGEGLVKALREGRATVTAKVKEGEASAVCEIKVIPASGIGSMDYTVCSAYVLDGTIRILGGAGYRFALETAGGERLTRFDVTEDEATVSVAVGQGVYLLKGIQGKDTVVFKLIFR